jgi:phospholipase C
VSDRNDAEGAEETSVPARGDAPTERSGDEAVASRRNFLRFAGFGAAGVAATAAAAFGVSKLGGAVPPAAAPVPTPTGSLPPRPDGPGFDHLVVLMYENRSFDNLLGYLYSDGGLPDGVTFDGLTDQHANTTSAGHRVAAHRYTGGTDVIMSSPRPDPGEEYPHVNTQLFGTVDPESNRHKKVDEMTAPFNAPADTSKPTMEGFLQDYINTYIADHSGTEPTEAEYSVAMGAFDPGMLPVISTLASQFAVYDSWHCAVPSQTFGNRSFFHASTSHGYVTNSGSGGYRKWFDKANASPTIFDRLSDAGLDWAVYYDDKQIISMTGFIHAPSLEKYFRTNFRTMSQFYVDVAQGTLPAYSFVEPRMIYDHNDMHPPVGPLTETDVDGTIISGGAVSDVRAGEALLHQIYSAIRASGTVEGSNAMNTMLLVTFDEHGGIFDHVPPPAATPPGDGAKGEMDFGFDRLGVRVPAIAISAYTAKNTVIHDPMHHGSVISTLTTKFGLDPLTARDDGAPTIDNATNLTTPRDPTTWPQTTPQYVPANPERDMPFEAASEERPLSPPGVGLVGMLIAKYGEPGDEVPVTYQQAYELLTKRGQNIFGSG